MNNGEEKEEDQLKKDRTFSGHFDLNKQLAFRYFQLAIYQDQTKHKAMLKLADFLYYGSSGVQDFNQAERIYKLTSEGTTDSDVKGHALFKLGMMN